MRDGEEVGNEASLVNTVIIGLGNPLRTDDGIGLLILRRLRSGYSFDGQTSLVEGGTRGLALIDSLLDADLALIIDAADAGKPPGAVFCVEEGLLPDKDARSLSVHDLDLPQILQLAQTLGRKTRAFVIGIQPQDAESFGSGLSDLLAAAFEQILTDVVGKLRELGVSLREA